MATGSKVLSKPSDAGEWISFPPSGWLRGLRRCTQDQCPAAAVTMSTTVVADDNTHVLPCSSGDQESDGVSPR